MVSVSSLWEIVCYRICYDSVNLFLSLSLQFSCIFSVFFTFSHRSIMWSLTMPPRIAPMIAPTDVDSIFYVHPSEGLIPSSFHQSLMDLTTLHGVALCNALSVRRISFDLLMVLWKFIRFLIWIETLGNVVIISFTLSSSILSLIRLLLQSYFMKTLLTCGVIFMRGFPKLIVFVLHRYILQSTIWNKDRNRFLITSWSSNLFGKSLTHIALYLFAHVFINAVVLQCNLFVIIVLKIKSFSFYPV
jgi:hypothetical protein